MKLHIIFKPTTLDPVTIYIFLPMNNDVNDKADASSFRRPTDCKISKDREKPLHPIVK